MLTHDPTWDALPATGYRPAVRVTAYSVSAWLGAPIDIQVTDGWVLKDATQFPRTHAQVTTADTSLIPYQVASNLSPYGGWLKVEMGYTDTAGTTTYLTVHDGPITRVSAQRPDGLIAIESADPSVFASQKCYPTQVNLGVAYPDLPCTLAWDAAQATGQAWFTGPGGLAGVDYTQLTTAMTAIPIPTGWTWAAGTSDWSVCEEMCDLMGAEAFYRPDRKLYLRPVPQVGAPVYTLATGEAGTLTAYETALERTYNAVYLAYASGIVGTWKDDGAGSMMPSGYYGNYPLYETRTGTPTQAQADAAAKAYAARVKGTGRTTTLRAVPAPWLEPGDTVNVDPDGAPIEQHLIQSVSIPLGLDVMTVTTRNPVYTGIL